MARSETRPAGQPPECTRPPELFDHPDFIDLTGKEYNLLTVYGFAERRRVGKQWCKWWWCRCVCGRFIKVRDINLKDNHTKSCGDLSHRESRREKLEGTERGQWEVLEYVGNRMSGDQSVPWYRCRCKKCGGIEEVRGSSLKNSLSTQCQGCARKGIGDRSRIHGQSRTVEHQAWLRMKSRCYNKKSPDYPDYGGRGVTVCKRWLDSFKDFLADIGQCPPGHSLDRIDPHGNYEPGNCRWLPVGEQIDNRRNTIMVEYKGQLKPLRVWCKELNMPYRTVYPRIKQRGWDPARALETPVGNHHFRTSGDHETPDRTNRTTHNMTGSVEYAIWCGMKARCCNENSPAYARYGAKGIRVCERWLHSFANFYADVGPRPSSRHSLDRIDSKGNYEPGNVRWATPEEQGANQTKSIPLEFNGEKKTIRQWSLTTGIDEGRIAKRLKAGWGIERALTEPVGSSRRKSQA
jgi:hypothetical protein